VVSFVISYTGGWAAHPSTLVGFVQEANRGLWVALWGRVPLDTYLSALLGEALNHQMKRTEWDTYLPS
jgi:hypothetical protein